MDTLPQLSDEFDLVLVDYFAVIRFHRRWQMRRYCRRDLFFRGKGICW